MAGLKQVKEYDEYVVNICPNDTEGEVIEIGGINIQLPRSSKRQRHTQLWKGCSYANVETTSCARRTAKDSLYG